MLNVGSRELMRRAALIVAGAVLVMQFVLAAQACVLRPSASSAPMVAAQCEGSAMSSAACRIQCEKTADQIKPSVDFHFDVLPTPHVWADASLPSPSIGSASTGAPVFRWAVGPPLQILFCSFQS